MPIIRVEMFAGRTEQQKRALVRELTDAFVNVAGGTPESVNVVITDIDKNLRIILIKVDDIIIF